MHTMMNCLFLSFVYYEKKKDLTVIVNNFTNINKTNNYLSSQII